MSCSSNSTLRWEVMAAPPFGAPPSAVVAVAVLLLVVLAALLPPLLRLQPWSARECSMGCTCRSLKECCLCRPLARLSSVIVLVSLYCSSFIPGAGLLSSLCSWNIHATLRRDSGISISLWFPELACYIFNFKFGLLLAKPANDFLVSIRLIRNPICQLTVSILARAPCRLGPLIASFPEYLSFFAHCSHSCAFLWFLSEESAYFVCPVNRLGLVAAGCLSIITAKRQPKSERWD